MTIASQLGGGGGAAADQERQDHVMQAVLLLMKELEPSELELLRRDIDKKITSIRQSNARVL